MLYPPELRAHSPSYFTLTAWTAREIAPGRGIPYRAPEKSTLPRYPFPDHPAYGVLVVVQIHRLMNVFLRPERERTIHIRVVVRRTENDHCGFLRAVQREHRISRDFGNVQIEND